MIKFPLLAVALALAAAGCENKSDNKGSMNMSGGDRSTTPAAATVYTCTMHREVTASEPAAKCPKCGMSLVAKK
jgi:hypothetical protein